MGSSTPLSLFRDISSAFLNTNSTLEVIVYTSPKQWYRGLSLKFKFAVKLILSDNVMVNKIDFALLRFCAPSISLRTSFYLACYVFLMWPAEALESIVHSEVFGESPIRKQSQRQSQKSK